MKKLNKLERPLLTEVPKHPKLSETEFLQKYNDGVKVIDTRKKVDFAKGFIPGSINIQNNKTLSTWAGWLLSYDEDFVIVAPEEEMEEITRKLMRIGLDRVAGFISDVNLPGIELQKADVIGIEEFKTYLGKEEVQIVDVRGKTEYEEGHVEGAENVFVGTLPQNLDKISKEKQVVIHCQSGDRSAIAYSVLRKNGFNNVKNYSGGMKEWREKGNPVTS